MNLDEEIQKRMNSECSEMNKLNIYFIVSHPIQYFVPLYKLLAQKEDIDIKVLFFSDETVKGGLDHQFGVKFTWDIPLLDGYEYSFIKNKSWKPSLFNGFWGLFNPGIIGKLRHLPRGMVIINGWHFSTYIMSFVFAKIFGHAVAIRCEAPAFRELNRKGLKNKIRTFFLRRVLLGKLVDKCLYLGVQNKLFYEHYGVDNRKLVFSPYTIDNTRFKAGKSQFDREKERLNLGINSDDYVILFTGKFIPRKRPMDLIKAFHSLSIINKKLLLVGDGILRDEMKKYIEINEISVVHIIGFINQMELPKFYSIGDVLVLCSESETWGLSVNEAMACGLPIIVSDAVGCADDLVKNGQNGYIFPKGDVGALAVALENVYRNNHDSRIMGIESEKIINGYTIENTAKGIITAAQDVLSKVK
jgi:glycosyltransferase involved in cell wall biosynthesis